MSERNLQGADGHVMDAVGRLHRAKEMLDDAPGISYKLDIAIEQLIEAEMKIADLMKKERDAENGREQNAGT